MRLSTIVAVALLAMALFPVSDALAFSFEQQSGSSADNSSRIVDPDQQLDLFGLQNQKQGSSDQSSNMPNTNPALNAPNQGVNFPNPFAPLVEPRR